jgi:predicted membrane channel-forming protein YqfA (hemolysin III family)
MFWIFMLIAGGAATFAALGMYSVWLKVMTITLLAAGIIILGLIGALLWRRVFPKQ